MVGPGVIVCNVSPRCRVYAGLCPGDHAERPSQDALQIKEVYLGLTTGLTMTEGRTH